MSFLPLVFGWPMFLYPVQVVFLEFVIDPTCSIVFEAESSERDAMQRPPRDPKARLFDARMLSGSLALGATVLAAVCLAYWWAVAAGRSEGEARALGFTAIVFGNLALIFASRCGERSMLAAFARPNPALWWVVSATLAALAAAVYLPALAEVFRFSPLRAGDVLVALAAGVAGVACFEAAKRWLRPCESSAGQLAHEGLDPAQQHFHRDRGQDQATAPENSTSVGGR
jgi:Ca2+-transporting ATPase